MSTHNILFYGVGTHYPQHMFLYRNNENYPQIILKYPQSLDLAPALNHIPSKPCLIDFFATVSKKGAFLSNHTKL